MKAVFCMANVISALEQQKKNKNRINIEINGVFAFSLNRIVTAWLRIGQVLSDQQILLLRQGDAKETVLQSALKYLNYRIRSEYEMRTHLVRKGFAMSTIDNVITDLKSRELISDKVFAKEWVENRCNSKPRGRRMLAYELKLKRINQEDIDDSLVNLPDEITLAIQAGQKVKRHYQNLDSQTLKKKIATHLFRRGFSYEDIKKAITYLCEEVLQKQN